MTFSAYKSQYYIGSAQINPGDKFNVIPASVYAEATMVIIQARADVNARFQTGEQDILLVAGVTYSFNINMVRNIEVTSGGRITLFFFRGNP